MPGGGIAIDVAELAGVVAEGPLFGVFLVLDLAAIYILTRRRRYSRPNIPMILAGVVMLFLSTAQFIVDATNLFMAFIPLNRVARIAFFSDLTHPIFAAKHAIYFTMMLVGDAIVIYRCYHVWNRNLWIVLFSILCSLGSAACAYQSIWAIRHFNLQTLPIRLEHNMGFVIFSLSFAANFIATSLLAYKIWKADRSLKTLALPHENSMIPIVRIVIESGAINTAYLLAYTITLQSGSRAIEIMASIVTPLVGIIFATVILRAGLAAELDARTNATNMRFSGAPAFATVGSVSQDDGQNSSVTAQGNVSNSSAEKKRTKFLESF